MKPTQEKILQWAEKVWGVDLTKPSNKSALEHIEVLATLVYEAGCAAERKACIDIAEQHATIEGIAQKIAATIRERGRYE